MIKPKKLERGISKIRLIATARNVSKVQVDRYKQYFESQGFEVDIASNLMSFTEGQYFAGTDEDRINALQESLDDPSLDALWAVRGGYGTSRIIDCLNFDQFLKYPKWVVGYSDLTILLSTIVKNNVCALHAAAPINLDMESVSNQNLLLALDTLTTGNIFCKSQVSQFNRKGIATGRLIGGNLSILAHSIGTKGEFSYGNSILFIEDLDEYLYHIDRMMTQLYRAGRLNNIAGLIIGSFTEMKDHSPSFGKSFEEIILEKIDWLGLKIPVLSGFYTGHGRDNMPLILGPNYQLTVNSEEQYELKIIDM